MRIIACFIVLLLATGTATAQVTTTSKDTSQHTAQPRKSDTLVRVTVIGVKAPTPSANITLSREDIVRTGSVLGEANIYEALQKQAGIIHTTEVNSGLFVRGLNAGNTGMLLDGVNTFSGNHLLGIYPPANADAFSKVQLLKDNIHPKYNGFLGSYLLLETPDKVPDSVRGQAELGILTSKLGVQAPVIRNKLGIISNVRRSYFDLISNTYNRLNKGKADYSPLPVYGFYDWNNTIVLNSRAGLFKLNTMSSGDRLSMDDSQLNLDGHWKNLTIGINWQYQLTSGLCLTVNAGTSRYQADASYKSIGRQLQNEVRESGAGADFHWQLDKSYSLDYGLFAKSYRLSMTSSSLDAADSTQQHITVDKRAENIGAYIYTTIAVTRHLQVRLGTTVSRYKSDKPFTALAPTFNMTYTWYQQAINVSINRQLQYAHLYVPTGIQLPINIWYPSVKNAPPADAWHVTAGYSRAFGHKIKASMAAYYIRQPHQTEFLDKNYFSSLDFKTVQGAGASRGVELNAYYTSSQWRLEAHYTYGKTTGRFPGINEGQAYPLPYDIRHKADMVIQWQFTPRWTFSLSQYVQSGGVITMPTGLYIHQDADLGDGGLQPVPVYTVRNNYRMPLSHRMDVSVKHAFDLGKIRCSWTAGIYNTYSYQNPYFIYFKIRQTEDGERYLQAKTKSILPMVPFISLHTEF
ncbi:TonB-dependent receptor plug domain-containing protein [Paraflavitalea pollutisoli]|uniref:TonB-dependent receptor plug domain-containing protein n=1 Tax=Paraflavitalea pollutisoli TaxID=3034143 RepID=UPI0023EDA869|nr:TonB-dependent receptor plug domain-containing protein [Paraflavitalea sp. H1-2-19X]